MAWEAPCSSCLSSYELGVPASWDSGTGVPGEQRQHERDLPPALGSLEHPGTLAAVAAALLPTSVQPPPAPSATGRAGGMLGLLTPGNRESARCRRCRPAPGAPAAVPRRAGVLCPVRVKKAPFVRQCRPVTNERLQPPAPGETGMGETPGWAKSPCPGAEELAGECPAWSVWPSYGM